MDYERKYKQAIDRAVNLFATNNISATVACEIFPELNKSEEMNYEQKYKEALERARDLMTKQNPPAFDENLIGIVFPELKESEDERIVKCLLNYFNHVRYNGLDLKGTDIDEVIAWLEKQGKRLG